MHFDIDVFEKTNSLKPKSFIKLSIRREMVKEMVLLLTRNTCNKSFVIFLFQRDARQC